MLVRHVLWKTYRCWLWIWEGDLLCDALRCRVVLMVEGMGDNFSFCICKMGVLVPTSKGFQCSGLFQELETFLINWRCLAGILGLGIPMLDIWERERWWWGGDWISRPLLILGFCFVFFVFIYPDWTQLDKEVIIKFTVQSQVENRKSLRVYLKLQSLFL